MKFLSKDKDAVIMRQLMEDLKEQQGQLVHSIREDEDESGHRVSVVLSDLETYMAKLETIIQRLVNVTETLVEENDARIKPWYVRIFCP